MVCVGSCMPALGLIVTRYTTLQAQELITALHNACQQLASTATGKTAEARLQKALDKLQKLQQKPIETTAAWGGAAQLPTGHAQPVEAPTGTGQQAAGAEQKAASTNQNSAGAHRKEDIVLVTAGEDMAEGASGQGRSAAVLAEASQANGEPPSSVADVEMTPVEDQEAGSAKENTAPSQGQSAKGQQPSGDEQTDKGMLLAEKKAHKEEAKVRCHKSLRKCILLSCRSCCQTGHNAAHTLFPLHGCMPLILWHAGLTVSCLPCYCAI